jgi:hypothetical protein
MTTIAEAIAGLSAADRKARAHAATYLNHAGSELASELLARWRQEPDFDALLLRRELRELSTALKNLVSQARANIFPTVGVAVTPETFERIRNANGSPRLAEVPPDQDAAEFELHFSVAYEIPVLLDILTTKDSGGNGAIAKFLAKNGEGIQQVEYEVSDVDRATQILIERFGQKPVYPATRMGANGTRVNFFLITVHDEGKVWDGKKVLIELVEPAKPR